MTKKIEDGGPAFPHMAADGHPDYRLGLSRRDWLAGQALAGLLAKNFDDGSDFLHEAGPDAAAFQAYRMADAMIAASKSNGVSE